MNKITVKNMDGTLEEVDLVNAFEIEELKKDFIILSKGENAGENLSKIYVSEVVEESPGIYKLIGIADDNIWSQVKNAMKQIVNDGIESEE